MTLKRRSFLQTLSGALAGIAALFRAPVTTTLVAAPPDAPTVALVANPPFRINRVKLPGGWLYESTSMDGPEVWVEWQKSGGTPQSRAPRYPAFDDPPELHGTIQMVNGRPIRYEAAPAWGKPTQILPPR